MNHLPHGVRCKRRRGQITDVGGGEIQRIYLKWAGDRRPARAGTSDRLGPKADNAIIGRCREISSGPSASLKLRRTRDFYFRRKRPSPALLTRRCPLPQGQKTNLSHSTTRFRPYVSTLRTKLILHLRSARTLRSSASSKGLWIQPEAMWDAMSEVRRRGLKPSRSGDRSWSGPLTVGAQGPE
jgi:hypothetical protein